MEKLLLPSGFYDLLPPVARQETRLINHCLEQFAARGYEQVGLPLLEFEDTLLAAWGQALSHRIFRVMDPLSHRVMGLRPDMTMQIARIATSRLADVPRPLRLSYAGPVLQLAAEKLQMDRQLTQVGAELFGADQIEADAEILILAAETLEGMGIKDISIDLNLPSLIASLLDLSRFSKEDIAALDEVIARKDSSQLTMLASDKQTVLAGLMDAAGPASFGLKAIRKLALPEAARTQCDQLEALVALVKQQKPSLHLTIDPIEKRGFEYHSGVSFSIFAQGVKNEIGRGGRYLIPLDQENTHFETAIGFTLYIHVLQDVLPLQPRGKRLLVPAGTSEEESAPWRKQGYITVASFDAAANARAEAKRLGCDHVLIKGQAETL